MHQIKQFPMNRINVDRMNALKVVPSKVQVTDTVMDMGSGIRIQDFFEPRVHICVDPHLPYLMHLNEVSKRKNLVFINSPWDHIMKLLPSNSVDTVFALDFIEHLEKEDGFSFFQEAERVARKQVILFTPLGFFEQTYGDADKSDRWGMDGGCWQSHRSGWHPEDFGKGCFFVICEDFIIHDEDNQLLNEPRGAFWVIKNVETEGTTVKSAYAPGSIRSRLKKKILRLADQL